MTVIKIPPIATIKNTMSQFAGFLINAQLIQRSGIV
jgi:hypothetical protein